MGEDVSGQSDCGHPWPQVVLQDEPLFSSAVLLLGTLGAHLGEKLFRTKLEREISRKSSAALSYPNLYSSPTKDIGC